MDNKKLVTDKQGELKDLYSRMDETKDLIYLTPYSLTDFDGTTKIDRVVSVTRNLPAIHANTLINKILKAKWQTVVESSAKMSGSQTRTIEQFSDDCWSQIDEFLFQKFDLPTLDEWLASHIIARGLIGARIVTYFEDNNFMIDVLPCDMRYTPWERGEWACPITFRTKAACSGEWWFSEGLKLEDSDNEIWDFWNKEVNEIYVKGDKVDERPNPYGEIPFAITGASAGFLLRDSGYMEYEFQDALFLDRDLYKELNRSASIAQTLGMDIVQPGTFQEKQNRGDKPDVPPMSGENVVVGAGEEFKRFPRGDLNNAFVESSTKIEGDIARGGTTDTELGANGADRSALWVTTQNELLSEKLLPRLNSIGRFKQMATRLLINKYQLLSKSAKTKIEIGSSGMKRIYTGEQLGDPKTYTIQYRPLPQSKEQNIANESRAVALKGHIPDLYIYRDVLQAEDPEGMKRDMDLQRAQESDPSLMYQNLALQYCDEAKELSGVDKDAKLLMSMKCTENAVIIARQRKAAVQQVPQVQQPESNGQPLMSLAGKAGTGVRA